MSVVRLEIRDAVGHIVLDRPPANSYDKAFLDDLSAAIDEARVTAAAEGAYNIGLPEVTLGVLPGTGGTQRLPRLIGRQKALDLMLRGAAVSPAQAKELGIVDEVYPAAELQEKTHEYAAKMASGPTLAIGKIKVATVLGGG